MLYKEETVWVAHCLELDLVGGGNTKKRALADLSLLKINAGGVRIPDAETREYSNLTSQSSALVFA